MRHQQNAVLTSLRQAQDFLDENGTILGAVNASSRKQLDDVVAQLTELSVTQDSGSHGSVGETSRQRDFRLKLRRTYMAPIAEIAKFKLRDVPEFAALRLPSPSVSIQGAVAAAYSMADAAAVHAQAFVDGGLPATFVDDLRAAAAAVSASVVDRGRQRVRHVTATASLSSEEKRGRSVLRVLNVLILAHIGSDKGLLAGWATAKAVRRKPGLAAGSPPAGAADAAPTHPVLVPATVAATPSPLPVPSPAPVSVEVAA